MIQPEKGTAGTHRTDTGDCIGSLSGVARGLRRSNRGTFLHIKAKS